MLVSRMQEAIHRSSRDADADAESNIDNEDTQVMLVAIVDSGNDVMLNANGKLPLAIVVTRMKHWSHGAADGYIGKDDTQPVIVAI